MKDKLPKKSNSGLRFICLLLYTGLVGYIIVMIIFVSFFAADSSNITGAHIEIFDIILVSLYLWSLIKINKWSKH